MPAIGDNVQRCAVHLYRSIDDATDGVAHGGTGFLACYPFSKNHELLHYYFIANDHVASFAPVVRANTWSDTAKAIPYQPSDWLRHPDGDDIAATPFHPNEDVGFRIVPIGIDEFLSSESVTDGTLLTGEDVFMIGRYINHEGRQRNLPTARFGSISMLPLEKVRHRGLLVDAFLVDMRSISGFSGSPTFVHTGMSLLRRTARARADGEAPRDVMQRFAGLGSPRVLLLGIDSGHASMKERIRSDSNGQIANEYRDYYVESNTGIATVLPAWKILETLNRREFVTQREDDERRYYSPRAIVTLD